MTPDPPTEEEIEEIQREIEEEQEQWDPLDLPDSQAQLVRDILEFDGPKEMIERVGAGLYHDYVSPHPAPKHLLVADAVEYGLDQIAIRAQQGRYDP